MLGKNGEIAEVYDTIIIKITNVWRRFKPIRAHHGQIQQIDNIIVIEIKRVFHCQSMVGS
jgi:hypothetical protein